MALERQLHLLRRHPHSVVHHPDQPAAGVLQVHLRPPGAGVHGVFQELLEHRGGPLDDLAGRDLVHQVIGQPDDARHGSSFNTLGGGGRGAPPPLPTPPPGTEGGGNAPARTPVRHGSSFNVACQRAKRFNAWSGVRPARSSAASSLSSGWGAAGKSASWAPCSGAAAGSTWRAASSSLRSTFARSI